MALPERLQELIIRDDLGVVSNLNYLCMTRDSTADFLVTGIRDGSTGITRLYRRDTRKLLEDRFCTPETSASNG